jgi:hypothetical protein
VGSAARVSTTVTGGAGFVAEVGFADGMADFARAGDAA